MTEFSVNISGKDEFPKHARVLLVGQPGVGKTFAATSFPNPLWINAACGLTTLASIGGIPYVNYSTENDLFTVKEFLDSGRAESVLGQKIETLVIDSVDELQRLLLVERLKKERRTETKLDDWGWLNSRLHAIMSGLDQLALNVVFISHTKEVNVGEDVVIKPAIAGQFCEHIHEYVDMSLMMHARTVSDQAVEGVEILGMKTSMTLSAHSDVSVDRWIVTGPQSEAEWVNDKTGKLPAVIDLSESNFFDVINSALSADNLQESSSITVPSVEEVVEPEQKPKPEPVTQEEEVDEGVENCSECSVEITQKTWSDLSKMRFGVPMCGDCFKKKG